MNAPRPKIAKIDAQAERAALEFIAAHVEGNLLAAHQEIQKLGPLHPPGDLSLAQVHAALAYYYDNTAEIEAELERDEAFEEHFERLKAEHLARRAK